MNKPKTVTETADLAQELRSAAARVEGEKAKLERESAQRGAALARERDSELQRLAEAHQARQDEAAKLRAGQLAEADRNRAARAKRIESAFAASRKQALERIEQQESRRKFAVQKGMLDTDKQRDSRLKELEREFQETSAACQEEQHRLGFLRAEGRKALRVYWTFPRLLDQPSAARELDRRTAPELLKETADLRQQAEAELRRFRARVLPVLFRFLPIWLWWLAAAGLYFAGASRIGLGISEAGFVKLIGAIVGGATLLYAVGWPLAAGPARAFARKLLESEAALDAALRAAQARDANETAGTKNEAAQKVTAFQEEWESATRDAAAERGALEARLRERIARATGKNAALFASRQGSSESLSRKNLEALQAEHESAAAQTRAKWQERIAALEKDQARQMLALEADWASVLQRIRPALESARSFAAEHFRPWSAQDAFRPPEEPLDAVKFGQLQFDVTDPFGGKILIDAPLMLAAPAENSLFIESDAAGRPSAIQCLNNVVFRILQTVPPGKAAFTFIDPVHLGASFSTIMHLADYEENIVHRRIWTEPAEIEERLSELNAHMEKVIQMHLRNEFRDIVAYNRQAGRIAEKYHFLVLADFPANFSDTAMRRLLKIAASGARCGVYLLAHSDMRMPMPPGFERSDLIQACVHLQATREGIVLPRLGGGARGWAKIGLDAPPEPELATRFLQEVGEASRGSNTVQVPFEQIAPERDERWTLDTTDELRVAIGRAGATKLQYLSLGKGTRQHVLIAGKTGSGKSTLFHVLVTNLALWCGPDQAEFYLVDFKKGVEFKDYAGAKLPHARVIAIESDREFGLSVLRRVDEELRTRGELFRAAGAQDLAGYKRATGGARMPRVLLIVDEFQELFTEDDAIAQNAALLLDRIVRQGRAFGIHVILGSQTLGGAYSLARSTLGQMVVRVALQCNEADAYLIMDENNPAPRLLSRPGEGIYNDSGGAIEANSPFQVVWLPEGERRAALESIHELAKERGERNEPVVFEGNSLADLAENAELAAALDKLQAGPARSGEKVWLGLPNEIKGPTQVVLDRRGGRNLLIAGQNDDHARTLLAAAIVSLAAQNSPGAARFVLLENAAGGPRLSLHEVGAMIPHPTRMVKASESGEVFRELAEEIDRREAGAAGPNVFVLIHNLSAFKALRPEDEFSISLDDSKPSPAADFQRVCMEGPAHGIHVIAHVDGFNNASRYLGRKGLKEFSARVLFQMSASDSASLSDDARAGNLGLNRALLYDEQEGTYELFRPYARPDSTWLARTAARLASGGDSHEAKAEPPSEHAA